MLVPALFLLMAIVSTASCFAELSFLMQSDAIGRLAMHAIRGGDSELKRVSLVYAMRAPKAHSPALVDIPPRAELAGLYRLTFSARFALPFKAMMNSQPIKNGRLFQSDHLRSIQP
ncbi:MAG: hypothetical protein QOH31_2485 [Verrucomicrobiota bacterium]|jgi:hypothetical protein